MVSSPSQALEVPSSSGLLMQDISITVSSPPAINTLEACSPIKALGLSFCQLQPEDWAKVIKAIDFSVIEVLSFKSSNFAMEQLRILIDCMSCEVGDNSVVSLQSLDLYDTKLSNHNRNGVMKLFAKLKEKVP
ncbi:hypothetical protein BGX26_004728, partial [Mortierella sp. AD094]